MTFWTSERLRDARGLFTPFDGAQVTNCSVELRMGPEGYVTGGAVGVKTFLKALGDQLVIPPGQFALLLAEESVTIPDDAIAFISMKSKFKLHGLMNVSGFHVDPGFIGQLIFAVYNAGGHDVVISRGDCVFLLWVASLNGKTGDVYEGPRKNQNTIRNDDIVAIGRAHYSTAAFNDRLTEVQARVDVFSRLTMALLVGLALLFGGVVVDWVRDRSSATPVSTTSVAQTPTKSPTPIATPSPSRP